MQRVMRRRLLGVAAMLVCAGPALAAGTARPDVSIDNFTFTPALLKVRRGTTVVWTNRDDIPHTVTSADGGKTFRSAPLDTDDRFSFTFTRPGRYSYFCSLHPMMQGTIVVE